MFRLFVFLSLLWMPGAWAATTDVPSSVDDVPAATHVYAGVALSDKDAADVTPVKSDVSSNRSSGALVSINTASPLDLNWAGAMELGDPALRPDAVVLPFLEDYPLDNLEVKFRLLNLQF